MGTGQSLAESTPAIAPEATSSVPAAPQEFDYSGAWQAAGEQFLQQQSGGAVDAPLAPESLPGEPPATAPAPAEAPPAQHADAQPAPQSQGQRPSEAVPYDRFQQVTTENQRLAREAQEARDHASALQKAVGAGFQTVQEYQQADAYAKQNNFASIEAMQATYRNAQQLKQFESTVDQKLGPVSEFLDPETRDWLRTTLLQTQGQNLANQAMYAELQQQSKFTQAQLTEQAIASAQSKFASFGIPMDPAFEQHLRTQNPVDIARIADTQANYIKSVIQNATGQYAATKLAQQQVRPPMGAGGAPPPPMQPPSRDSQFNPQSGSFMDAMGFDPDKIGPSAEQIRALLDSNRR